MSETKVDTAAPSKVSETELDIDTGAPVEWKKYESYAVAVDPDQDDKASEIRLCKFARPHMRAFHCSWVAFFMAFIIWFSIAPLLPEIRTSLGLSKEEVWTSNIVGVGGTIFVRFLLGPLTDKYGSRTLFALVLCFASIPTACTGFVNTSVGFSVLRLFIGVAGGTFVMCQYWTSRMFTREVVGTANALVGGWGNLGGGVTHLFMGSAMFPLFKIFFDGDADKAWRTCFVVPAFIAFAVGVMIYFISDDAPKGNYTDLKKHGQMPEVSAAASFRSGALNFNTWILAFHYGCSFGVELTMINAAALYFHDEFGLSTENAAATASLFGWMNLFSRGSGGFFSDMANRRIGMRGRLLVHTFCLAAEGALVLVFANTPTLGAAIAVMLFFSYFVQATAGTTFGIVPYVDPPSTGSIAGIVGAGGNVGAVVFGLGFRNLPTYKEAFVLMGSIVLGSCLLSSFVLIKGHAGIMFGKDDPLPTKEPQLLAIPEPDAEKADEVNKE